MTTSFWGMRGKEDIGGGNAVFFALESFFRPNTGQMGRNTTDGLFSRNAYVGLTGAYGTFKFGEQTNPTYFNQILVNPFGGSVVFSPLIVQSYTASYNNTQIGDTVWANAVEYVSPNYGGLTGTAIYGVSSTTDIRKRSAHSGALGAACTGGGGRAVERTISVSRRRCIRCKAHQALWGRADDQ
jgi:predicted porin